MKILLNKYDAEWRVTGQDVKLYARGVYVKVTEKSLTMSDHTARAVWIGYQLVSCLVMRIG
jgi:hypothetical protein